MNTLQKTAGAILSLSLLCGMQVYAFPDYPSLRGQIIEQSDICQGVVKDANGESIIGASVLVKGTTNGSITGLDGDFSLRNVKKGDIIVVSYVGYQSQEIAWTGGPLNIVLKEDAANDVALCHREVSRGGAQGVYEALMGNENR